MRIQRIEINNFFSFDEFCWEGLSPGLNVVVGPNGTEDEPRTRPWERIRLRTLKLDLIP